MSRGRIILSYSIFILFISESLQILLLKTKISYYINQTPTFQYPFCQYPVQRLHLTFSTLLLHLLNVLHPKLFSLLTLSLLVALHKIPRIRYNE